MVGLVVYTGMLRLSDDVTRMDGWKRRMRLRGIPVVMKISRTAVNVMIMARNHQKPAVHAVSRIGQSIRTPGGPSAMSRAKWISSPATHPAVRPVPAAHRRG